MKILKWFFAWSSAVLFTALAGSVIQTQLNLARLAELGVPVPPDERLRTTAQDLLGFAPLWAIIVAAGLLVALFAASGLARLLGRATTVLHAVAGFLAPLTALLLMEALLPVTVIAAARSWTGMLLMSLPGAMGGWIYARLWAQRQKGQIFHQAAQRNSSSQAGS
jgi:hypothetical protein